MERPWAAENAVSPALARALIEAQFPELSPANVELLGVGWDNTAYRVGADLVFRFPRREIAVELLRTESRVLRAIGPLLPLAVPDPRFLGEPVPGFPWPFAGYRWIPGRTACRAGLDDRDRERAARPLALFLRALHDVPAEIAARAEVPPDTLGRLDLEKRIRQIAERSAEAERLGLVDQTGRCDAILEGLPDAWAPGTGTLVHGDLYARHLLLDERKRPCGVIDWGDVHLGDPAVDLSIAHGFLPPSAHDAFRDAYGPIDHASWRVARMKALHAALVTLLYGHDVGDVPLEREARLALSHLTSGDGQKSSGTTWS